MRVGNSQHPPSQHRMLLSLWVPFLHLVFAQTWYALFPLQSEELLYSLEHTRCGKVYEQGIPVVPPVGQFPLPVATSPQLALRCNPAQTPFLPDDLDTPSSVILVDALVWSRAIAGAQPLNTMSQDSELQVTVSDIASSSAPEVTSSYVTTWVRVGVNRAQVLYDTVVSSVFHMFPFASIEFWTMYSASFSLFPYASVRFRFLL